MVSSTLPNPVDFLEAAYALEQPRDAWVRGVLEAAGSSFDRGAGVAFILYDVSMSRLRIEVMEGVNLVPGHREIGVRLHRLRSVQALLVQRYRGSVCTTAADDLTERASSHILYDGYAEVGIADQLRINGGDPSGLGCALCVFSKQRLQLTDAERQLMSRMAAHLSAAYRLFRHLHRPGPEREQAVLKADGRVEHRWSLIDRFERDGHRYIIARENVPAPTGIGALSERERQVASLATLGHSNKLIAYELGLAHSTVRVLLARAGAKVGARTRRDLIDRLRAVELADVPTPGAAAAILPLKFA